MNPFKNISKRPIFRELSWYTFAQIVVQIVAFISAIVVTRYLGPVNLGLYSFVQNYVATLLTVGGGMDFYFMWKIAKSDNHVADVQQFVGYKFSIYILLTTFGIIGAIIVLPNDLAFLVAIMLVPACLNSLSVFSLYVTATERARLMSVVQIIVSLALLVVKVVLVYTHSPLYFFVMVAAADSALGGIIIATVLLRQPLWKGFFRTFRLPSFMKSVTFLYSIRFSVLAIVFWQLLLRVDQLILATFSNGYTLGIYAAAVKIAEVPNFLAGVLSTALVSRMALISDKRDEASLNRLRKIMLFYFFVGLAIAVVIIVCAPFAVRVLYGYQFEGSIAVLRAYALSIPAMYMNYFFLGMYGARDKYYQQIGIFAFALAANIILIYVLTPILGIPGTALATAIAYTIAALCFYINIKK